VKSTQQQIWETQQNNKENKTKAITYRRSTRTAADDPVETEGTEELSQRKQRRRQEKHAWRRRGGNKEEEERIGKEEDKLSRYISNK